MNNPPKPFDLGNSNSSFGMAWSSSFCEQCKHDHFYHNGCSILLQAMFGKEIPKEHIYDEENNPICTSFELDDDLENRWSDE